MKRNLVYRPAGQRILGALLCLFAVGLTSPWPGLQMVAHVALILGFALDPESALLTAVWAGAGGWIVEGTLRIYPHYGGTAWADMTVALLARWLIKTWPLEGFRNWFGRQAALAALAALWMVLVHLAVRLAAGPHLWGSGWIWVALGLPLWSWLTGWWHRTGAR